MYRRGRAGRHRYTAATSRRSIGLHQQAAAAAARARRLATGALHQRHRPAMPYVSSRPPSDRPRASGLPPGRNLTRPVRRPQSAAQSGCLSECSGQTRPALTEEPDEVTQCGDAPGIGAAASGWHGPSRRITSESDRKTRRAYKRELVPGQLWEDPFRHRCPPCRFCREFRGGPETGRPPGQPVDSRTHPVARRCQRADLAVCRLSARLNGTWRVRLRF